MTKIKVVEIFNDKEKFESQVNELLNSGCNIISTSCGSHGFEDTTDTFYQAILICKE